MILNDVLDSNNQVDLNKLMIILNYTDLKILVNFLISFSFLKIINDNQ